MCRPRHGRDCADAGRAKRIRGGVRVSASRAQTPAGSRPGRHRGGALFHAYPRHAPPPGRCIPQCHPCRELLETALTSRPSPGPPASISRSPNVRLSQTTHAVGGAGGARTRDPGIMSDPNVPLTRTYCTAIACRVQQGRVQGRFLAISGYTPTPIGTVVRYRFSLRLGSGTCL